MTPDHYTPEQAARDIGDAIDAYAEFLIIIRRAVASARKDAAEEMRAKCERECRYWTPTYGAARCVEAIAAMKDEPAPIPAQKRVENRSESLESGPVNETGV